MEEALALVAEVRGSQRVGGMQTGDSRDKEGMEVKVMADERCCIVWLEGLRKKQIQIEK
jgi:hypothetical protein